MNTLKLGGIAFDGRYALVAAIVTHPAVVILDEGTGSLRTRPAAQVDHVEPALAIGAGSEEQRQIRLGWVRAANGLLDGDHQFMKDMRGPKEGPLSIQHMDLVAKQQLLVEAQRIVSGDFLAGMILPAYLGSGEDAQLKALTKLLTKIAA